MSSSEVETAARGRELKALRVAIVVTIVALLAVVLGTLIDRRPVTSEFQLRAADIVWAQGHAYAAALEPAPAFPLLTWKLDDEWLYRSGVLLFEDGIALPHPRAHLSEIQGQGHGRYMHTPSVLYFSSSDNSDPRANGKTYMVRATAGVPNSWMVAFCAVFATSLVACMALVTRQRFGAGIVVFGRVLVVPLIALVTAIWLWKIWSPAPLIVELGDAGNVASIVAGWMDRERFANDPVLGRSDHFRFYLSVTVPLTMAFYRLTSDIGQAYVLLVVPILALQMLGFYLLGQRLFRHRGWSVLLALVSVPPVYVLGGELWGNLAMPLTRAAFGALLPYILLAGLSRESLGRHRALLTLAVCGAGVYVHPVSAPTIAVASWLALLMDRPAETSKSRHITRMLGAGIAFLVFALPFAYFFFSGFPSVGGGLNEALASQALRRVVGLQYFDALVALDSILSERWGWRWIVWATGLFALFAIPLRHPQASADARFLRIFLVGVLLGSIGVAWLDQFIANRLDRLPTQIDLVRNIRFVVPLLLIGTVYLLSFEFARSQANGLKTASIASLGMLLFLLWSHWHPTPPGIAFRQLLLGGTPVHTISPSDREMVAHISQLPVGSVVLPLPAEGREVELVGLAIRYAARQPVAHLTKDLNLLSYTSSERLAGWIATKSDLERLGEFGGTNDMQVLHRIIRRYGVSHLLIHKPSASDQLLAATEKMGHEVHDIGDWHLLSLHSR